MYALPPALTLPFTSGTYNNCSPPNNYKIRARGNVQSIKYLPSRHNDLSSSLGIHGFKKPWPYLQSQHPGKWRPADPWDLLVEPTWEFLSQQKTPMSKRVNSTSGRYSKVVLWTWPISSPEKSWSKFGSDRMMSSLVQFISPQKDIFSIGVAQWHPFFFWM